MPTSGSNAETFSVTDIIDASLRLAGVDPQMATWEVEECRKQLELVMLSWAGKKILPWFLKRHTITVTTTNNSYGLSYEYLDVLHARYKEGDTPVLLQYVNREKWDSLDTTHTGAPQFFHYNAKVGPVLQIYPKGDKSYTVDLWVAYRGDDPTSGEQSLPVDTIAMSALQKQVAVEMFRLLPIAHRAQYQSVHADLIAAAKMAFDELVKAKGVSADRWRWRRM